MAVTVGTSTTGTDASFSHTVNAGSDLALIVAVGSHQGATTAVTYGGVALTKITSGASTFVEEGSLWILLNPTVGAANVVVTNGAWEGSIALNLSGVRQTTTITNAKVDNGDSNPASGTITPTVSNCLILSAIGTEGNTITAGGTGGTIVATVTGQSFETASLQYFLQGIAAEKTLDFGMHAIKRYGIAMAAIEPSVATSPKSLAQSEFEWFATRSGQPANAPLSQHKRTYFKKYISNAAEKSTNNLNELEAAWIRTTLGVTSRSLPTLWEHMVSLGVGITPSKSMNENRYLFYSSGVEVN